MFPLFLLYYLFLKSTGFTTGVKPLHATKTDARVMARPGWANWEGHYKLKTGRGIMEMVNIESEPVNRGRLNNTIFV